MEKLPQFKSLGQQTKLILGPSTLLRALERRSERLAAWYSGAYQTLADNGHPDKLACAAHGFREVIEKFPECAGLVVEDVAGNAANILEKTKREFDSLLERSQAAAADWQCLDQPTRQFLVSLRQRFGTYENRSNRTEQMRETIQLLVPGAATVSASHQDGFLRAWNALRRYFALVAHHRTSVDERDFNQRVSELERMIGTQLTPTPTDDMDLIDRMIAEAESGD